MAFMMPVVKNDWDIYKCNRSRKSSESTQVPPAGTRSRKISECRSEGQGSFSNASKIMVEVPTMAKHHSMPDRMATRGFSRPRTCSENLPGRAKVSTTSPPEKNDASSSCENLKRSTSWLDKLRKFMRNNKSREEERTKS